MPTDSKILDLPAALSLGGDESIPIVQSGQNKQVSAQTIADLASPGGVNVKEVDGNPSAVNVANIVFPNGTLGYDSGTSTVTYTPAASGGASITSGAYASRPATGNAGALYVATDSPITSYDNGSSWEEYAFGMKLTPPPASGWSWVNQGHASLDTTKGGVRIYIPSASAATSQMSCYVRSVTAPYTIELGFLMHGTVPGATGPHHAACWRNSGGSGLVLPGFRIPGAVTSSDWLNLKWTSPTVYSATYASAAVSMPGTFILMRISDDSTNRKVEVSYNLGRSWATWQSVGRTDFLTADQAGIAIEEISGKSSDLHLLHWNVS